MTSRGREILTTPASRRAWLAHCTNAGSGGRGGRIVIFSGGPREEDEMVFEEVRAIRDGGGFGSIIGRNSFQRPRRGAIKFLQTIMEIYAAETA